MNALLRHFAIRFWATALLGMGGCMVVMPFWQSILKLQWVLAPVVVVMICTYLFLGIVMTQLGLGKIRRLVNEAGVWERGGVAETAEDVYARAVSVFDSFWLSPLGRRKGEEIIMAPLARFHLTQSVTHQPSGDLVRRYLIRHPEDASVVNTWLEYLQSKPFATIHDDLTAAQIGTENSDDIQIQYLLVQYYLSHQRYDFEAMTTYRRAWDLASGLPDALLFSLARLLLSRKCLNDWALMVYLKGFQAGESACLEGIAAAVKYLNPHPGNDRLLAEARRIDAGVDSVFRETAIRTFQPAVALSDVQALTPADHAGRPARFAGLRMAVISLNAPKSIVIASVNLINRLILSIGKWRRSHRKIKWNARLFRIGAISAFSLFVLAVFLLFGYQYRRGIGVRETANVQEPPAPMPPITKPFTIQVAAYLKPEDAQRFVDQLQKKGLDAFSTEAVSAHRKWYQVKVARFATKLSAREYGEKLKSQGVIDDFYVANFQQ